MKSVIGIVAAGAIALGTAACNGNGTGTAAGPAGGEPTVQFSQAAAASLTADESTTSTSVPPAPPTGPSATSNTQASSAPSSTPAPAPAPSSTPECDEGHWPATVDGRPWMFHQGGPAGYYIWHAADGWHLRTTTPEPERHVFTGTITSTDNIKVVHEWHDEAGDYVTTKGNVILFRFDTHNHVDGVDFIVGCTQSVTFDLRGEGQQWPADRIALGFTGRAASDPFTVSRTQ